MALPMVVLAKLGFICVTHGGLNPVLTALLWPLVLKFAFSFSPLCEGCVDMAHAVSLFFFQVGHIILDRDQPSGAPTGGMRWQRALRLVCERIFHARRAQSKAAGEERLFAVSILAL